MWCDGCEDVLDGFPQTVRQNLLIAVYGGMGGHDHSLGCFSDSLLRHFSYAEGSAAVVLLLQDSGSVHCLKIVSRLVVQAVRMEPLQWPSAWPG